MISSLMSRCREKLAILETLDVGKPILNSVQVDVANAATCIEYYALAAGADLKPIRTTYR
ncbi:MAG TPA: hypothetical protein VIY54_09580 [Steroidobacteraceae bacterium]